MPMIGAVPHLLQAGDGQIGLPVHHVIAAEQLAGCCTGAFAFFKRDRAVDDSVANASSLLDQAPLATRKVRGIERTIIEKAEFLLVVDDNVRCVTLPQDSPVGEP